MSFCTEVVTKWPLTLSLSRFKKAHIFFVGAFTAFLLNGNIVGIASGSSMALKPYRTGCEGPVQSIPFRKTYMTYTRTTPATHLIPMFLNASKCNVGPTHNPYTHTPALFKQFTVYKACSAHYMPTLNTLSPGICSRMGKIYRDCIFKILI